MRRILPLMLTLALVLSGCTGGPNPATKTPEELTQRYSDAITAARDEELNQAYPILTNSQDELAEMVFQLLGVEEQDMTAYAISVSLRNITAYGVAAIMPASGKEQTVKTGLETFVENQTRSFQNYLEDQYAVAKAARLESLEDGTLLLVMCENQDKVFDAVKKSIEN